MTSYAPEVHPSAYIAPGAHVLGQVKLDEGANIWPASVLRGDINSITIGKYSNIQDGSICHVEQDLACVVGDHVVCGHRVILHACTIEDQVLIGMGSIVLNGARVERGAMLGAGSLVTEGKVIKAGTLWMGSPARYVRDLTEEEIKQTFWWAQKYYELSLAHRDGKFERADSDSFGDEA